MANIRNIFINSAPGRIAYYAVFFYMRPSEDGNFAVDRIMSLFMICLSHLGSEWPGAASTLVAMMSWARRHSACVGESLLGEQSPIVQP